MADAGLSKSSVQRARVNWSPHPAIVVPFGGENQVVLDTSGMDVDVRSPAVKFQEFEGRGAHHGTASRREG